jgi:hypothetical protein
MIITAHKFLTALTVSVTAVATISMTASAQQKPQTTKESIKGAPTVLTEHLQGTVEYVEGNDLVVRMSGGGIREFHVPDTRRFLIDGRELTVHELAPGTKLTAVVNTTTTPVIERTTTIGSGKVWFVSGKTVILTLPDGENRTFTVGDNYRFIVDGNHKASVADLRKGMTVSAQKIVESPRTEIASDTVVTGKAPAKGGLVQRTPAPRQN